MRFRPLAVLDRGVSVRAESGTARQRLSDYRSAQAYVLLGEPGSGKSRAFEQEAELAGTDVVTARDFAAGDRPDGTTVFIDALEEYRIAEAGGDRLDTLLKALAQAGYLQWRIACRAISLPRLDAERLARRVGQFNTLQLEALDRAEQSAILVAYGHAQAQDFIQRMFAIGAAALLGNPSTLLLLHETIARADGPLVTRGQLLDEATRQMAHPSDELPDDPNRPPASKIITAAERASIILLLSNRSDIWLLNAKSPGEHVITRDDLLPAGIDTQALRAALDTPLFSGDGSSYMPTHRFVAEYLAGRALAHATAPEVSSVAALSLERAIAFLHGDDDRPAPALTGIFAWFVIMLSRSIHASRALDLVRREPAAILFHGDAAMMPTEHRLVLLSAIGRDDPWFLGGNRGSTGLAGLAGSDLIDAFQTILEDPSETPHRRALVLMALAAGRPVPALADSVHAIFVADRDEDFYDRRTASEAYAHIKGETPALYREMLGALDGQESSTALQLKIGLLAQCLPDAKADEVRALLIAYARTGDGVMGYADPLGRALCKHPLPGVFDKPLELRRHSGQSRPHEVARVVDKALAATIGATSNLSADRLVDWLDHAGFNRYEDVEADIRSAIMAWIEAKDGRELELIDTLRQRLGTPWETMHQFHVFTGCRASDEAAGALIERIDDYLPGPARVAAAELVTWAIRPFQDRAELYWEFWKRLDGQADLRQILEQSDRCLLDVWQTRDARRQKKQEAKEIGVRKHDQRWYDEHREEVRAGGDRGLSYPAKIYLGHISSAATNGRGEEGLRAWVGDKAFETIVEGWNALAQRDAENAFAAGRRVADKSVSNLAEILVCWADQRVATGEALHASGVVLLGVAHYAFMLPTDQGKAVTEAALSRFFARPDAETLLLSFWKGAITSYDERLPLLSDISDELPARGALAVLLTTRSVLPEQMLRSTLEAAARILLPIQLLALAQTALSRPLSDYMRRFWAFTAWALDPTSQAALFDSEFSTAEDHQLFGELWNGPIGDLAKNGIANGVARLETIITRLARLYPPSEASRLSGSGPPAIIDRAISRLSENPSAEASAAFDRLIATDGLAAWSSSLAHERERQSEVRRRDEFRPPQPRTIAAALLAGPPATPGDLRAVVVECLNELAHDIRCGPTSPWRGFWNRPYNGEKTPKIENDCRDLLVDRLGDRLRRFGIAVEFATTEARSSNDRRADVLVTSFHPILAGRGPASVPIEAKRHWNDELWSAIDDQLVPYCTSAGSNGHGVYLVFWFGTTWPTRAHPTGDERPTSAKALKAALEARLKPELATSIKIIVVDVSEPTKS
ncbi:hypothetical protein [Sphingomonas sp. PP-CE-1G-424]|uniref:hypothetical protein n=1 Tax=Sphingomonas sp. PP-CE-1G-424 TaxID=2135658 RepID=UPI0010550C55|nr:hypothetical protein [Sphingomonas sp. PP-CE-1G-424]TCP64865.1 hypothetical protein C8J43_11516 [Sphingomonas sp. PP-CE-1G-424]